MPTFWGVGWVLGSKHNFLVECGCCKECDSIVLREDDIWSVKYLLVGFGALQTIREGIEIKEISCEGGD